MVDVVAAKTRAHQFLEEVGLFVAAFGGAKAHEGARAVGVAQAAQTVGGERQGLLPSCFAKHFLPAGGIPVQTGEGMFVFGHAALADERCGEAMGVMRIVKTKAPLDAQARLIGGAIITERVFAWEGMGSLFNRGLAAVDVNLVMGFFLVTGLFAVLGNLVADLLYSALDPRIRVQ